MIPFNDFIKYSIAVLLFIVGINIWIMVEDFSMRTSVSSGQIWSFTKYFIICSSALFATYYLYPKVSPATRRKARGFGFAGWFLLVLSMAVTSKDTGPVIASVFILFPIGFFIPLAIVCAFVLLSERYTAWQGTFRQDGEADPSANDPHETTSDFDPSRFKDPSSPNS